MYKTSYSLKWVLLFALIGSNIPSQAQLTSTGSVTNETKYDFGKDVIERRYDPGLETKYAVTKDAKGLPAAFIRFRNTTQKLAVVVCTIYPKEGAARNQEIQVTPNSMKVINLGHLSTFSVNLKFIDPLDATNPSRLHGGAMVEHIRLENGKLNAIGFKKDEAPAEVKKQSVKINADNITGANTIRTFELFFGKNCCAGMIINREDKGIAVKMMKELLQGSCLLPISAQSADFESNLKEISNRILETDFPDCVSSPTIGQYVIKEKEKISGKWKELFSARKKQGAW